MPATRPSSLALRSGRRAAWFIAGALFFSFAYFYQGTGWNQNSHFDLARVLVEQHTVCIDRYQAGTGDKAFYQGHYYSDKAPGLSLTAFPAVAAGWPLARAMRVRPRDAAHVQLYLAAVLTCSLGIALAAAVLFLMLLQWNVNASAAALAAVVFGVGTPMWVYATQFWGHALASACLVFAFAAADHLRHSATLRRRIALAAAIGLSAGWAVVTEYPAAIPAVLIGLMALFHCRRAMAERRTFFYPAAALCVTALLCLAVILVYQNAAFGSPFRLGYEYVVNYQGTLRHGALGLSYPRLHPLAALLFGKRCGLLLLAPILVVAPLGVWRLWRAGLPRFGLAVAAGIALYYLLFNASYLYWEAGASFGPRYLSPGLPFACLFVAPVWQWAKPALKGVLAALAAFGVAVAFAGVATHPVISEAVRFPIAAALPALARGELYQQGGAWNLGQLAGLHGWASLAPLIGGWVIALSLGRRLAARAPTMPDTAARRVSTAPDR